MTLTQGHLGKAKITDRKSAEFVYGPIFFMGRYWKLLFHTMITYQSES